MIAINRGTATVTRPLPSGRYTELAASDGARWDGGRWQLRYVQRHGAENPYMHATATKIATPHQRVTMDLGS